ncbi:CcoQ/FixQ family Cbb3-type cytochrome c oxidase assembly chaperone [Altererythrobacter aerius]|uniref:CcoQ/FixQ family Cbb3-type cytochrome c oxidase assembly chaperone n=2 Tax=Tsuneonella aeria TaxID=1837929 RepID=A0A6I4TDU0_9SPHN|nr:CcoQ/FixQ family Cbb3-type cytochrome c oxidase assembly chaperone [Tsuneonella aeria]
MMGHSTYETMRQFADSWGLFAMVVIFTVLVAWPFRPGGRKHSDDAANVIFRDENDDD